MTTTDTEVPAVLRGRDIAVVDVEGNGYHPPEIIEIAIIPVTGATVGPEAILACRIRPQHPIVPFETRHVHGISNKDVFSCPAWKVVAPAVGRALDGRTLVAHNATAEYKTLARHLPEWKPPMVLDTLRLAKVVWPDLPSYALDALLDHASLNSLLPAEHRHHYAGCNAWSEWLLLCHLVCASGLDWDGVIAAAALPEFVRH
ncbi:PolC-type DNA polymerase III [Nocardia sp. XZ_19_385]|uniref:3'-5' exonuclease n=1 Tax=Nocardia sp. XZ_19_385 TaxID=2769488 RepID=UPI00188F2F02|nr:3'-5' exonuclease [Nocardia sp. XZ_19_385]